MIRKIAITGPESTGKSTLSEQLALHFDTVFVPEFARMYLDKMGTKYQMEDVLNIAKGQIESERHWMDAANNYLFCDTDLINIKIWLEHKYNEVPEWLMNSVVQNEYDLYLLMDIDLPWEADPLREYPNDQAYFFNKFRDELEKINARYIIISGPGDQRLKQAIEVINDTFPLIQMNDQG